VVAILTIVFCILILEERMTKFKTIFLMATISVLAVYAALTLNANGQSQSSFGEILNVISSNNPVTTDEDSAELKAQAEVEAAVYRSGGLPQYKGVEEESLGFWQRGNLLFAAAKRTLKQSVDSYPRIEKLVHSNGICFSGIWEIDDTATNTFTGYFGKGKKGLFIGRASAAGQTTKADEIRGFGFAGKIYPTLDPSRMVSTGNFFTVDILPGTVHSYLGSEFTNKPENNIGKSSGAQQKLLAQVAATLLLAGGDPGFRPLYPVTELQEAGGTAIPAPKGPVLMKLRFTGVRTNAAGVSSEDFREELKLEEGQKHVLDILTATSKSPDNNGWTKIGQITLDNSFVSYGCDRRLHFPHPKLR
jgi:hypothetical protein